MVITQTPTKNETVHKTTSSHKPPSTTTGDGDKQKKFKLKGVWRETQLSKPRVSQDKYVAPYDGPLKVNQQNVTINPETLQRCNNMAFVNLRTLTYNKTVFKDVLSRKRQKNLTKQMEKTNNSVYFEYRKWIKMNEEKEMRLHERMAQKEKKKEKKEEKEEETEEQKAERYKKLSTPKKIVEEPPPDRGKQIALKTWTRMHDLAEPHKRDILPPRDNKISKAAKNYVATENVIRLAQPHKRYMSIEPPLESTRPVPKSALTYKITPQIQKLYTVKVRKEGAATTPEEDIWKISPAALKYQATPRILQLAKHTERR